ncbi:MAG: ABC transporter permease [Syntrophales bacterium]|nr:ABC transporter permease [Syntrophales bacterium]
MRLHNISFNNLRRRKGKTIFLITGLLIGIATIVTLLTITENMSRDIEERLDRFGANIVMVPKSENLSLSYGGVTVGGVNYTIEEFDENRLGALREIENAENIGIIAPKVLGPVEIRGKQVLLMGIDPESELPLKTWWHFEGVPPSHSTDLAVGSEAAKALGLAIGDSVMLGGKNFVVTAILQPTGAAEDGIVIGELHAIQGVLEKPGKISLVEISAFCNGCPITEMALQIAEKFPNARVNALKQAMMSKMQSIDMFKSFSYGVAALVIFIGSLLVFVTMMGSVNERTREIGIFRAIGFRRGHVMRIIMIEAIFIGFLAGLLGFGVGRGLAWIVIPFVIPGSSLSGLSGTLGVVALLLGVSLSLLASLYPALKASKLDPTTALRAI